jgi:hypothetical protein
MMSPDSGEDLVTALRALGASLEQGTVVEASGEIRDPSVLVLSEDGSRTERRLGGHWDMLSAQGYVTAAGECTLYVHLARESAAGPQHVGGVLAAGRVVTARVRASVAQGLALPASRSSQPAAVPPDREPTPARPPQPPSSPGTTSSPSAAAPTGSPPSPLLPKRPQRELGPEVYPEEGDIVTHFAFGRCLVVMSDGERIRLQQERDGRVREVALSMLRMEEPTVVDGKRHWELQRKN